MDYKRKDELCRCSGWGAECPACYAVRVARTLQRSWSKLDVDRPLRPRGPGSEWGMDIIEEVMHEQK